MYPPNPESQIYAKQFTGCVRPHRSLERGINSGGGDADGELCHTLFAVRGLQAGEAIGILRSVAHDGDRVRAHVLQDWSEFRRLSDECTEHFSVDTSPLRHGDIQLSASSAVLLHHRRDPRYEMWLRR